MKTISNWLAATGALLLSACASTGMHADNYSPAANGRGDYYTGAASYGRAYDWPWDFHVGVVPWGGYCPVRYRYCTSLWSDPFYMQAWYGYFYSPFYDPFWYQPWLVVYRPPPPRLPPDAMPIPLAGRSRVLPPPSERPGPRAWEERPLPRAGALGSPRPRVRPPRPTGGSN